METQQVIENKLLDNTSLSEGIQLLKQTIDTFGLWDLQNSMEETMFTYDSMLKYMLQNYLSPTVNSDYEKLRKAFLELNDKTNRELRIKENKDFYASLARTAERKLSIETSLETLTVVGYSLANLEDSEENAREKVYEHKLNDLVSQQDTVRQSVFYRLWISDIWTNGEYEYVCHFMENDSVSTNNKSIVLSAIILGLLEYFDVHKFLLLFKTYFAQHIALASQAMVGIVIASRLYNKRMQIYDELKNMTATINSNKDYIDQLYRIIMQLQYSNITDDVSKKMNEDIYPSIFTTANTTQLKNASITFFDRDSNPDWETNKKMQKSVIELEKMIAEGADVHMCSFRHMKNFRFFDTMPRWFYPFELQLISVGTSIKQTDQKLWKAIEIIADQQNFCDSDKYSFLLSVSSLKSEGMGLGDILQQQIDALEKVSELKNKTKITWNDAVRNYIFNLYRFYFVFRRKNEFHNPFCLSEEESKQMTNSFLPDSSAFLDGISFSREHIHKLAVFHMSKGLYQVAISLFIKYAPDMSENDAETWQQLGFCYEKLEDSENAIINYEIADECMPDTKWTLHHLASLYMKRKQHHKATVVLEHLLKIEPDNQKYLYNMSVACAECKRYNDVLKYAYKLYYFDTEYPKLKELLIDTLIHTGELDKASEMVFASDRCQDAIIAAIILMKEENYISAHEMLKTAWTKWQMEDQKEKDDFHTVYYDIINKYAELLNIPHVIINMLYDATIIK